MAVRAMERQRFNFHWSSILAGTAVALGTLLLLYSLGAAIGMLVAGERPPAQRIGPWAGIVAVVAPIIALLIGGFVTGRADAIESRASGALHGAVVWGLSVVIGSLLIGTVATFGITQTRAEIPVGYSWALFGSFLLSLLAAMSGGFTAAREHYPPERERYEPTVRREAHP